MTLLKYTSRGNPTEMKYLKGIIGITRFDVVRNCPVRAELTQEPIIRTHLSQII